MAVELVKTLIRLAFTEELRPWLEVRDLFRIASGDENADLKGEPTYFGHEQKKQRIGFNMREFSFEQEGAEPIDLVFENALQAFSDLDCASPFPTLVQVRINSIFIQPHEMSFQELCLLVRRTYLQNTQLVEQATDVGVTLDQHEGHVLKHVQIGPMEQDQLQKTILRWPRESVPDQFLFIGLGFEWNVEMAFNARDLGSVLEDARAWQENAVKRVMSDISNTAGE